MTLWTPRRQGNEVCHGFGSTFQFPPFILDLLDTAEVQRTRRVSQLGFVPFVFPSAAQPRLPHLLGTAQRALEMWQAVQHNGPSPLGDYTSIVGSAALLHDIGHPPFSHALEALIEHYTGRTHEQIGAEMITGEFSLREFWSSLPDSVVSSNNRQETLEVLGRIPLIPEVLTHYGIPPETVAQCIDRSRVRNGQPDHIGRNHIIREVIDHPLVDADKMDYLLRDAGATGIDEVGFSPERIIASLGVVEDGDGYHLAVERGGIESLSFLLHTRKRMYTTAYTHPTTLKVEGMIYEACKRFLRSLPEERREEYQRSLFLLDDGQFEQLMDAHATDSVALQLFKTARDDRRNKYEICYELDSRDIPPFLDDVKDSNLTVRILTAFRDIKGDFPEDIVRQRILARANAGSRKPKLEEHEVIVYTRTSKGLKTREDFLNRFALYIFSKKNPQFGQGKLDFSGKPFYRASDVLRNPAMYDEHLDFLFRTFVRHELSRYFLVLAPEQHAERVQNATKEYIQKELLR